LRAKTAATPIRAVITLADLEQEQDYFRAGGYELKLMDN